MNNKILIVEDDEQLLFIISKYLENVGYKTSVAVNGNKAIEVLKSEPDIELVITDLLMPELDGLELCSYIRNDSELKDLPILIITGQADIFFKCQGFNAGADDYIVKPIEFVEFMLRIKALLRRKSGDNLNDIEPSASGLIDGKSPKVSDSLNASEIKVLTKNGQSLIIDKSNSTVRLNNKSVYLTSTEFEIMNYLLQKRLEPTTSEELLEKVMNYPPGAGNPVAIRTHIRNIRTKLESDPNNPDILINIPKRGYILNID